MACGRNPKWLCSPKKNHFSFSLQSRWVEFSPTKSVEMVCGPQCQNLKSFCLSAASSLGCCPLSQVPHGSQPCQYCNQWEGEIGGWQGLHFHFKGEVQKLNFHFAGFNPCVHKEDWKIQSLFGMARYPAKQFLLKKKRMVIGEQLTISVKIVLH